MVTIEYFTEALALGLQYFQTLGLKMVWSWVGALNILIFFKSQNEDDHEDHLDKI